MVSCYSKSRYPVTAADSDWSHTAADSDWSHTAAADRAIDHDYDSWLSVLGLAQAALDKLRCKFKLPTLLNRPFYVHLSCTAELIQYQGHITKLEKDVKDKEMMLRDKEKSLAQATASLREKDLEIQKLTSQQPRKQAKR